jgi:hypothetical protein
MTEQKSSDTQRGSDKGDKFRLDRDDEDQDFVDQSKIDFDPDDGLYSGSAVNGDSEIPGPHLDNETGELTGMEEAKQSASSGDSAESGANENGVSDEQDAKD